MYFRIIPADGSFRLHRSPELSECEEISGRTVALVDIQSGVDNTNDKELQAFYLAIQVLMVGEKRQANTVKVLTTAGVRDVKTGVKTVADYLEIYRYPAIVRQRDYKAERTGIEMDNYNELIKQLKTVFEPIKLNTLRLPAVNPSAYSYTVPDALLTVVTPDCKKYLKSFVTRTITSREFEKIKTDLLLEYPDDAIMVTESMKKTECPDHLSAISFNDKGGQLLVTIVNVKGDLIQMEGYKFLRLIEAHDNGKGGWLGLGDLDREKEWMPEPLIKFNKEKTGEFRARYSARNSCIYAQHMVREKNDKESKEGQKSLFIIDQDYLVCLYVAIVRLKNDKQKFERLREIADTKEILDMADLLEESD